MTKLIVLIVAFSCVGWPVQGVKLAVASQPAPTLESRFVSPPEATKPRCYWYWKKGLVSKEGLTKDLEAMRRVGIGVAYIAVIQSGGDIVPLSEPWWQMLDHAVREGSRLGVDIGMFNCPGWSQSGGPWVKSGDSMRYMVMEELRLSGPGPAELKFPKLGKNVEPIAYLAMPLPVGDDDEIAKHSPQISGDTKTGIVYEVAEPFTARSLTVEPKGKTDVLCELEASMDGKTFQSVGKLSLDRRWRDPNAGPVAMASTTIGFKATTARLFRLKFSRPCEIGSITISAAARVGSYMEKQLASMLQREPGAFEDYTWPKTPEPEKPEFVISQNQIVEIQPTTDSKGELIWSVPPGQWLVQRLTVKPTGAYNRPAPREGTGPEVDKMSRAALKKHFDAYIGRMLTRLPKQERSSFKYVIADSWEMGPQNWVVDFFADFQARYGYDAKAFLPVLSGRVVGGTDVSDRFLWDLRRMIADRITRDYVGGLRDLANANGLKLWVENYATRGFPAEFLSYGGASDEVSAEFWVGPYEENKIGPMETRLAASAAHTYGKPAVFAEAFTSSGNGFAATPGSLKRSGDWAFCQGINQYVLHLNLHQPDERAPGINAWFATEFNRHNTWFEHATPWIHYQQRCSVLLQAGNPVADVAYFIGEDAPKSVGPVKPLLPNGFDFDYINAEVLQNRIQVKDGRFVLPEGTSYRLLVLPPSETMRPSLLKRIRELAEAGGTIQCATAPERSPSLQDFPECDCIVQNTGKELWDSGKIIKQDDLQSVLRKLGATADVVVPQGVLWKHRREGERDIYFLSNQTGEKIAGAFIFRVNGSRPELWDAVSGERRPLPQFEATADSRCQIPLELAPYGSYFVVFNPATRDAEPKGVNFPELKPVVELAGRWEVEFDSKWFYPDTGMGGKATFEKLADWTTRPEPAIKHFSGRATYRKNFELPASENNASLILDLGKVFGVTRVRLNGRELGGTWTEPHQLKLGTAAKTGTNVLEIDVVNTWLNRLVGDLDLESAQRRTWLLEPINKTKLLPSGLLGPVQVLHAGQGEVK